MSGVSTNVGNQEIWSKFFANIALKKPPSENTTAVSTTDPRMRTGCAMGTRVKKSVTSVTTTPTSNPRISPPAT